MLAALLAIPIVVALTQDIDTGLQLHTVSISTQMLPAKLVACDFRLAAFFRPSWKEPS